MSEEKLQAQIWNLQEKLADALIKLQEMENWQTHLVEKEPIHILLSESAKDLGLPSYATIGSSGMDLKADIPQDKPITLKPLERRLVPTGITSSFSSHYEIQIRPRSGNALKKGLTVLNSPGTIDSDYRGTWGVILINLSNEDVLIQRGDKIAQAVLCPVEKGDIQSVTTLDDTERSSGGFGSTDSKK